MGQLGGIDVAVRGMRKRAHGQLSEFGVGRNVDDDDDTASVGRGLCQTM